MLLNSPVIRSIFNSFKQSIWRLFNIPKTSPNLRRTTKHILTGFILGWLCISLSFGFFQLIGTFKGNTSVAATTIVPPFSTRSSHIVDSTGKVVSLRGINWFGMEVETHAPHGLWVRDYKQMLRHIKSLGYNLIRLPYSVEALQSSQVTGIDFSIGANAEFYGKTPLEVMDLIIQEAGKQGLLILLDSHCLKDGHISELWYGDGFTEKDWVDTWILLANRYKNQPNIIGADLKNEPHGSASWGTDYTSTDWRLAAQNAGNKILQVNPNWLIVVEGVEKNVPNQRQHGYFWGANLEGVREYPIHLKKPHKLVYSPHEYGGAKVSWFQDAAFPSNLYQRWEIGFHYIATKRIAPIFVGEFGGYYVDSKSKEGIWQQKFVDYIKRNNLSFAYWCWNPNSKGTGGILQNDWQTVNAPKQALLSKLLS
ncbi:glycoside hydrolase family 5 protein [Plectonema cf. radiosum LEGE 06105]|uniref:cellulase n=1 Tax=Plectonema cf. radiosum LEGE 06105 TaxID=945769 RepID=A0A8J7JY38_9CYAN|nr:glycoside hydrolase family 5 protein [Plectonema cf. radiosum LEGE 06105]